MHRHIPRRLCHMVTAATLAMSWLAFTAPPTLAAPVFKLPLECGNTGGAYQGSTNPYHTNANEIDFNQDGDADHGDEVLASAAGWVSDTSQASNNGQITINHDGGWTTVYAHMTSIQVTQGEGVEVGELLGFIGNVGQSFGPHLHYQQNFNGVAQQAHFDGAPYTQGTWISSTLCLNPPFTDHFDSWVRGEINWLYENGITLGCDTIRYCPTFDVPRSDMAVFLARFFNLPATGTDFFWDDNGLPQEWAINRVAAAGITNGCGGGAFCPNSILLREQLATLLARRLVNLPASPPDAFWDDNGNFHEPNINKLAAAGITNGCGGGAYCPSAPVTREQMAGFLYRARNHRP